jgi:hypothetical protein
MPKELDMYKSKVLEYVIKDKPATGCDKEKLIEQIINLLKNASLGISLPVAIAISIGVPFLEVVFGFLTFSITDRPIFYIRICEVCPVIFFILFGLMIMIRSYEKLTIVNSIASLFKCLADKPYEVRCDFIKFWGNKIKVVVEDNTYLDGGHVIKEKTRHFTSYIDAYSPHTTILSAIVAIVKKAEADFGVAERAVPENRRK